MYMFQLIISITVDYFRKQNYWVGPRNGDRVALLNIMKWQFICNLDIFKTSKFNKTVLVRFYIYTYITERRVCGWNIVPFIYLYIHLFKEQKCTVVLFNNAVNWQSYPLSVTSTENGCDDNDRRNVQFWCTTNHTWTGPRRNPFHCGDRSVTDAVWLGTATTDCPIDKWVTAFRVKQCAFEECCVMPWHY